MSEYISARLAEIERLHRKDCAHYMSIPRHEVKWLVDTLREKMAECIEWKDQAIEILR